MDLTANIASILGLVLSILILLYSGTIKTAVNNAKSDLIGVIGREEVIVQIAHTITKVEKSSALLTIPDQAVLASVLLEEALSELIYYIERWRDSLSPERYEDLLASHFSLEDVRKKLSSGKGSLKSSREAIHSSILTLKVVEASLRKVG